MRQPRARGLTRVSAKRVGVASVLDGLRQSGSLKVLFPRAACGPLQAVLINTAGGVTGGDRFVTLARAGQGTQLTVTTQASERAYRAQPGQIGRVSTRLTVEAGAHLNWLPQETLLFDGCALDRALSIHMAETASLLMAEPLVFGRAAMGERLTDGLFRDRVEIRRDGRPLYLDRLRLNGDIAAQLARPTVAAGAGAMVSLVYIAPDAEAHLPVLRRLVPDMGGASLLAPDVLVMRALAPDSHLLRRSLIPILNRLTKGNLPRCWMI